jgi:hypothetical protein
MLTRRSLLGFIAAIPTVLTLASPAFAATPEIYAEDDVAVDGSDVVAYFTQSTNVAGSPEHTVSWKGAIWQFASAENAALFEATPEAYAPQYGGYCAFAMSKGYIAPTEPDAWTVHDGKLYLNFNTSVRSTWSRDIPGNIVKADGHWPTILDA